MRSNCLCSCTLGAQYFHLFHRFLRDFRHFFDVVLLRGRHTGVPQQAWYITRKWLGTSHSRGESSALSTPTTTTTSQPYCSFAYSALACLRTGMSGSASFQRAKKSSKAPF